MTWLDGYERMPLGSSVSGMTYAETDDPKLLWHMTQGSSVDGAVNAYRQYPPHLIVDYRNRRKVQHIDLDLASYSLAGTDNDRSRVVQVEVVGFSENAHLMSADEKQWLADNVVAPVRAAFGVPDIFVRCYAPHEVDFVLASPSSPIRFTVAGLRSFSGHLAHQHAPAPDEHWDAPFDLGDIIARSKTPDRPQTGDHDMMIQLLKPGGPIALVSGGIVSGMDAGAALETDRKAGGSLIVGVPQAVWDDLVRKSAAQESIPGLLANLIGAVETNTAVAREVLAELRQGPEGV